MASAERAAAIIVVSAKALILLLSEIGGHSEEPTSSPYKSKGPPRAVTPCGWCKAAVRQQLLLKSCLPTSIGVASKNNVLLFGPQYVRATEG